MFPVSRKQIAAAKVDDYTVVAEASTIGFKPGEWPDFLAVMQNDSFEGDGWLFKRDFTPDEYGAFTYRHQAGFKIVVLND